MEVTTMKVSVFYLSILVQPVELLFEVLGT